MAGGVSVAEIATEIQIKIVDNAMAPHFVPARHFFRMA